MPKVRDLIEQDEKVSKFLQEMVDKGLCSLDDDIDSCVDKINEAEESGTD